MKAIKSLRKLIGNYTGTSHLRRPWMSPSETESTSTASVTPAAKGKFITIQYTWMVDGESQEGLLLLGDEPEHNHVQVVWVDSWHMSDKFMICQGSVDSEGVINILGSYSAPPGPDWGWRTVIEPEDGNSFRIVMYNIPPGSQEEFAFDVRCTRQV